MTIRKFRRCLAEWSFENATVDVAGTAIPLSKITVEIEQRSGTIAVHFVTEDEYRSLILRLD